MAVNLKNKGDANTKQRKRTIESLTFWELKIIEVHTYLFQNNNINNKKRVGTLIIISIN